MTALTAMPLTFTSLPVGAQTIGERPDYWRYGWDWGWGHMLFGSLMMIVFWGGIIPLVALAVRWLGAGPANGTPSPPDKSALDILIERFARRDRLGGIRGTEKALVEPNSPQGFGNVAGRFARRGAP